MPAILHASRLRVGNDDVATTPRGKEYAHVACDDRATLARAAALTLALQAGLAAAGEGASEDGNARQIEAAPTRTGKERLGGKASDEQRVDNCKVPPDRRAARPRVRIHAAKTRARDRRAD